MRYKVTLSYSGAGFYGWQVQPDRPSVQEALEKALSTLLGTAVSVTGAGRTDTGVNALGFVAHFEASDPVDCKQLCYKLNAILPRSVVVLDVSVSPDGFHARFDASRREYTYFLHTVKDPFAEAYSYRCGYKLDFEAMNQAARLLAGTHDFSCFEKLGTDTKTSICTVFDAFWQPYSPVITPSGVNLDTAPGPDTSVPGLAKQRGNAIPDPGCPDDTIAGCQDRAASGSGETSPLLSVSPGPGRREAERLPAGQYWYFRIAADRFLRNMVRAVVGTLLEVGRGKRSIEEFSSLILPPDTPASDEGCRRSLAGESVPGHALFLSKVEYPQK